MSKVSVLIPVYNAESYLNKTIESVLSQSYKNIEVIVVDDGSKDRSLEIANSFGTNNVKVVAQESAGACVARNRAFASSTGDYIQYLDADDLLSQDKIEKQVQLLKESDNNVVASCNWFSFREENDLVNPNFNIRDIDKDYNEPIDWLLDSWEGKGMSANSCWLVPRHLIEKAGNWDDRLLINQDGEFFCRVLLLAKQILYSSSAKVFYRKGNEQSITGKMTEPKCLSQLLSYQLCEKQILKVEDSYRVRHALMCNYLSFIYANYRICTKCIKEAKNAVRRLGFKNLKPYGGKRFKVLAQIVGFENALKMRSIFNSF